MLQASRLISFVSTAIQDKQKAAGNMVCELRGGVVPALTPNSSAFMQRVFAHLQFFFRELDPQDVNGASWLVGRAAILHIWDEIKVKDPDTISLKENMPLLMMSLRVSKATF